MMEALVLMGGFIAFVVFGCCLMGRLDSFLDGIPDGGAEQRQKIFWKDTDYSSKVQKFIRQLCGQKL